MIGRIMTEKKIRKSKYTKTKITLGALFMVACAPSCHAGDGGPTMHAAPPSASVLSQGTSSAGISEHGGEFIPSSSMGSGRPVVGTAEALDVTEHGSSGQRGAVTLLTAERVHSGGAFSSSEEEYEEEYEEEDYSGGPGSDVERSVDAGASTRTRRRRAQSLSTGEFSQSGKEDRHAEFEDEQKTPVKVEVQMDSAAMQLLLPFDEKKLELRGYKLFKGLFLPLLSDGDNPVVVKRLMHAVAGMIVLGKDDATNVAYPKLLDLLNQSLREDPSGAQIESFKEPLKAIGYTENLDSVTTWADLKDHLVRGILGAMGGFLSSHDWEEADLAVPIKTDETIAWAKKASLSPALYRDLLLTDFERVGKGGFSILDTTHPGDRAQFTSKLLGCADATWDEDAVLAALYPHIFGPLGDGETIPKDWHKNVDIERSLPFEMTGAIDKLGMMFALGVLGGEQAILRNTMFSYELKATAGTSLVSVDLLSFWVHGALKGEFAKAVVVAKALAKVETDLTVEALTLDKLKSEINVDESVYKGLTYAQAFVIATLQESLDALAAKGKAEASESFKLLAAMFDKNIGTINGVIEAAMSSLSSAKGGDEDTEAAEADPDVFYRSIISGLKTATVESKKDDEVGGGGVPPKNSKAQEWYTTFVDLLAEKGLIDEDALSAKMTKATGLEAQLGEKQKSYAEALKAIGEDTTLAKLLEELKDFKPVLPKDDDKVSSEDAAADSSEAVDDSAKDETKVADESVADESKNDDDVDAAAAGNKAAFEKLEARAQTVIKAAEKQFETLQNAKKAWSATPPAKAADSDADVKDAESEDAVETSIASSLRMLIAELNRWCAEQKGKIAELKAHSANYSGEWNGIEVKDSQEADVADAADATDEVESSEASAVESKEKSQQDETGDPETEKTDPAKVKKESTIKLGKTPPASLGERITALEAQVSQMKSMVGRLEAFENPADDGDGRKASSDFEGKVRAIKGRIAIIKGTYSGQKELMEALVKLEEDLVKLIDRFQGEQVQSSQDMKNTLSGIEKQIGKLDADIAKTVQAGANAEKLLKALQTKLEVIKTQLEGLEDLKKAIGSNADGKTIHQVLDDISALVQVAIQKLQDEVATLNNLKASVDDATQKKELTWFDWAYKGTIVLACVSALVSFLLDYLFPLFTTVEEEQDRGEAVLDEQVETSLDGEDEDDDDEDDE